MFAAQKRIIVEKKQLGLTLMSDLHIGAINVDYSALRSDLKRAREHNDRILINGDVFDAILLHDMKRFRAETLDERSRGRSNILNEVVHRAAEELAPYADLIDMIGCGNHEESVEKYHNYDPIQDLINELNRVAGADIRYGGICGFFRYRLQEKKNSKSKNPGGDRWQYLVFYHHGSGGASPVTKGIIQFNRMETWIVADLLWVGHGHNRILDATPMQITMGVDETITARPYRAVMTGGYLGRGAVDTHKSYIVDRRPKNASYAESKNLPPQCAGGARVIVSLARNAQIERVGVLM